LPANNYATNEDQMRIHPSRKYLVRGAFVSGALALLSLAARAIPEGSAAEFASGSESSRSLAPFAAQLSYVAVRGFSITVPGTTGGVVQLNMPAPVNKSGLGVTVSLQSSNPSVASVPPTVYIPMSRDSGTFTVTGLSAGCTSITASYGGVARLDHLVVHAAAASPSLSLTVPDRFIVAGQTVRGSINKRMAISGSSLPGSGGTITLTPVTFVLSSSNSAVAKVPSSVVQTSDATPFSITGASITAATPACAIITAKTGTYSASKTVNVFPYIPG
jgi:hypothetical protein